MSYQNKELIMKEEKISLYKLIKYHASHEMLKWFIEKYWIERNYKPINIIGINRVGKMHGVEAITVYNDALHENRMDFCAWLKWHDFETLGE